MNQSRERGAMFPLVSGVGSAINGKSTHLSTAHFIPAIEGQAKWYPSSKPKVEYMVYHNAPLSTHGPKMTLNLLHRLYGPEDTAFCTLPERFGVALMRCLMASDCNHAGFPSDSAQMGVAMIATGFEMIHTHDWGRWGKRNQTVWGHWYELVARGIRHPATLPGAYFLQLVQGDMIEVQEDGFA